MIGAVIRRESERDYLDAAIGQVLLGDPLRTLDEVAEACGNITRGGVWMAERRILIKLGRAVRASVEEELMAKQASLTKFQAGVGR